MTPLPGSPPNVPSSSPGSSPTTTSPARERTVDAVTSRHAGESRFRRRAGRRVGCRRGRGARPRGGCHARLQRGRPAVRAADLRGRQGGRRRLPRHGDEPVAAGTRASPTPRSASSSATTSWRRRGSGRPTAGSPSSASASSPGLSDVFARYAADHLFSHIDELGTRDGANLVIRDEEGNEVFAPGLLDVDDHRGVPQPARGVGARAGRRRRRVLRRRGRLLHPAAVQPSRRSSTSPRASVRSSACTSSTRRCSSCRAGSRPTRSPSSTASARR